jgi:transcription elongation GreA/GreB family factor
VSGSVYAVLEGPAVVGGLDDLAVVCQPIEQGWMHQSRHEAPWLIDVPPGPAHTERILVQRRKMSRAFVKEQDADAFEGLPDRRVSEHPNDVTQEGLAQIEAKLGAAREAHAAAHAADDRAAMAEKLRDMRYWSARRATARVVLNPSDTTQVRFGSSVSIRRADGREQTFRIVGEDEADPSRGTISHVSPLARSLFGKRVGDIVTVGNGGVEIRAIR